MITEWWPPQISFYATGCQDTLDECSNLEPKDCYNKYYTTTCCKTCKALVQNPSVETCLYGDKGFGCSDLVPEVCHLSTQFCCQTCASYLSPRDSAKIPNTGSVFSSTPAFTNLIWAFVLIYNWNMIDVFLIFLSRFLYRPRRQRKFEIHQRLGRA